MRQILRVAAMSTLPLLIAAAVGAEIVSEVSLGSGYQTNIFSDSSMAGDVQTTAGAELRGYPASFAELASSVEYSAFGSHRDLSNLTGGLSATVIPSSGASRFTPVLSASATTRRFGPTYESYDQWGASSGIGFTWRLTSWMHLGSQAIYSITEYYNSASGSNRGGGLHGDLHLSLAGSNALSIGLDYSRRVYEQSFIASGAGVNPQDENRGDTETLAVSGVQLRYSRPLGVRTGVSLSVGRRFMHLDGDYVAPGYTVDFLSPWADLWSGNSLSGSIKHFFPRQVTAGVSVAYHDKTFAEVLEISDTDDTYQRYSRSDQTLTVSLTLARAISLGNGSLITPTLGAGYRDNRSSLALFSYDDLWASIALTVAP